MYNQGLKQFFASILRANYLIHISLYEDPESAQLFRKEKQRRGFHLSFCLCFVLSVFCSACCFKRVCFTLKRENLCWGKTLDFVKVRFLFSCCLYRGSFSFAFTYVSKERARVLLFFSFLGFRFSLSLYSSVVLFLLKLWSKDHREERERIGGNIRKKNDDVKSNNNALFLSFP